METNELIYLASCYSVGNAGPELRKQRFEFACRYAGDLMKQGHNVFSPIAHSHPIEKYFSDGKIEGHDFWLKQDFAVLDKCTAVYVLMMDQWEKSVGIGREIERAKEKGIPIYYVGVDVTA